MFSVKACALPGNALLQDYRRSGAYTDCYATDVAASVSHALFVEAFYTTFLFRLERLILKWMMSRPSSDFQAHQLAIGDTDSFAAWRVEGRANNQLLLSDYRGRTRSWLMVDESTTGTRLFFGSAVVPVAGDGDPKLGVIYRVLMGFHKMYSVALLSLARSRVTRKLQTIA